MSTEIQKLANVDDYHNALKNAGPNLVILFFYSTWSVPSIHLEKELLHIQYDCPEVEFSKIDVDKNGEVSEAYNVVRMPTLVFIKHSKTIDRLSEPDTKTTKEYIEHYR
mmetsp:Transcript_3728/g.4339  ORF Transcript_3728/g.4339 Transcript_3728/m.4339 type:complete len:109 (-) Transcript_3728:47-373(-)